MKKEFRLKKTRDFVTVFKEGKKLKSPHFILYMRENSLSHPRLGVSVSKSHVKLATRRNRLKRLTKELFRQELIPRFKSHDFVLASRLAAPKQEFDQVLKEIKDLIIKV